MRFPRVKAEGQSFYHCVSRVVDRRFIFQTAGHGSAEAERFVLLMRRLEAFSGVRVLTYALMSNHFHLLCEVPQARELCTGTRTASGTVSGGRVNTGRQVERCICGINLNHPSDPKDVFCS